MYAPEALRRAQRGFTLIELMVGLMVALLVGLAATFAAVGFNAHERQGVGAGVAVAGAANALSALKQQVGQAGLGFYGDTSYNCRSLAFSSGAANHSRASFAPLVAASGELADTLELVHASDVASGAAVPLRTADGLQSATLDSYLPATAGRAVLLMPAAGSGGSTCTVRSVTAVNTAGNGVQTLRFDGSGTHNGVSFANAPAYAAGDRVALLGEVHWSRYWLEGNLLRLEMPASGKPAATLLSGVVTMRVRYGIAPVGSAAVTDWVAPEGAWATLNPDNISRVRAVRIGLVTRSAQPEKPDANGVCRASDSLPVLFGRQVPLPAGWQCYRYRIDETTVPLRNTVMGMT